MLDKTNETVDYLTGKGVIDPEIGIILGTGLGKLVDEIEIIVSIDYTDIPNFPIATVEFHSGKLIYGGTNLKCNNVSMMTSIKNIMNKQKKRCLNKLNGLHKIDCLVEHENLQLILWRRN